MFRFRFCYKFFPSPAKKIGKIGGFILKIGENSNRTKKLEKIRTGHPA